MKELLLSFLICSLGPKQPKRLASGGGCSSLCAAAGNTSRCSRWQLRPCSASRAHTAWGDQPLATLQKNRVAMNRAVRRHLCCYVCFLKFKNNLFCFTRIKKVWLDHCWDTSKEKLNASGKSTINTDLRSIFVCHWCLCNVFSSLGFPLSAKSHGNCPCRPCLLSPLSYLRFGLRIFVLILAPLCPLY